MNDIHTKQKGNTEAALFNRLFLHVADAFHPFQVEKASHFTGADTFGHITALGLAGSNLTRHRKIQLTYFLFEGHLLHQVVDEAVHV